jgi:hypothetical protein
MGRPTIETGTLLERIQHCEATGYRILQTKRLFSKVTVTVAQAEVLDPYTTERVKTSARGSWDEAVELGERDELGRYIEARL